MADRDRTSALRGRWRCTHGGPRPDRFRGHRRLGPTALGHTILALAVFTAGLVVSVLVGLDDLDTPVDAIGLTIAVGWLTMCWFATAERVHAELPIRVGFVC